VGSRWVMSVLKGRLGAISDDWRAAHKLRQQDDE